MSGSTFRRYGGIIVTLLFIGGMTYIFSWLLDQQQNPNRANLTRVLEGGEREVVLKQNRAGHYVASGEINGRPVRFFLDTGATLVSIPGAVADALGLARGPALTARTANGDVTVYATRLERVRLGHIEMGNVPASINPGMGGQEILLGMSFLGELELVQRGEELRLRVPRP